MDRKVKIIVPKGRIQDKVMALLARVGAAIAVDGRALRPHCQDPEIEAKILKPQNIPALVALGRHDCGFTGRDWVVEQGADVAEVLDLGVDPVRIVAAVPEGMAKTWKSRKLVVASEYESIARGFIAAKGLDAVFVRSYGATEALPPEDADLVVDNTATGSTLRANRLEIVEEIMKSTTRFICSREALANPAKKSKIEELAMLMKSTLNAEERVLLEMNVSRERLDDVVRDIPCMKSPTVSPLHGEEGYAVKVAVPARDVPSLIPKLRAAGATDILEYRLEKIVV